MSLHTLIYTTEERPIVMFKLNGTTPELTYQSPRLILHRPTVGIEKEPAHLPDLKSLMQNYPNPFNSSTNIEYCLEKPSQVFLNVYDIKGRYLETLVHAKQEPGKYNAHFDSKNYPSGVYFYELLSNGKREAKKMMIVK